MLDVQLLGGIDGTEVSKGVAFTACSVVAAAAVVWAKRRFGSESKRAFWIEMCFPASCFLVTSLAYIYLSRTYHYHVPGKEFYLTTDKESQYLPIRAHITQGLTEAQAGDYKSAVREFRAAAAIDPKYLGVNADVAAAEIRLGEIDAATRALARELQVVDCLSQLTADEQTEFYYFAGDESTTPPDKRRQDLHAALEKVQCQVFYNQACIKSRAGGERDKLAAVEDLKQAIRHGFKDYNGLSRDPDLANLRDQSEFKTLVKKL